MFVTKALSGKCSFVPRAAGLSGTEPNFVCLFVYLPIRPTKDILHICYFLITKIVSNNIQVSDKKTTLLSTIYQNKLIMYLLVTFQRNTKPSTSCTNSIQLSDSMHIACSRLSVVGSENRYMGSQLEKTLQNKEITFSGIHAQASTNLLFL